MYKMHSNYRHLTFSDNFMLGLQYAELSININRRNRGCKSLNNEADSSDVGV